MPTEKLDPDAPFWHLGGPHPPVGTKVRVIDTDTEYIFVGLLVLSKTAPNHCSNCTCPEEYASCHNWFTLRDPDGAEHFFRPEACRPVLHEKTVND